MGSLYMADAVAGVYFVATRPQWRHRAIGSTLTWTLMAEAEQAGAERLVLSSSMAGLNVYRRLGFKEVFRYQLWEWSS